MIFRIKVPILIALAACVISIILCASSVLASNAITEVSASPDLRRVAIKSERQVGSHSVALMASPSRLVIDIPAAGVTQEPRVMGLDKDSALQVRIANTRSGAQVVLDFGTAPVPDHKVRQIDNYLIVLLGEWQSRPRTHGNAEPVKAPVKRPSSASPQNTPAVAHAVGSELLIKSVEDDNGLIVLKVAKRTEPQRVYRIELGVDFQHLGFNGATVNPVGGRRDGIDPLAGKASSWARPSAHGKKIGPRKMGVPVTVAPSAKVVRTTRKPASKSRVSPIVQARRNPQGSANRVELGRVRPYIPPPEGVTRKNLE
jgi:hypothetical protein